MEINKKKYDEKELQRIKASFFDFFRDSFNDLAPLKAKKITMKIAMNYVNDWVDKHFKDRI